MHPWENYKEFFIGQKETNGCRELMGIELPWIIKTFGKIKYLNTQKFKITSLDLDYPDIINIMLEHENGNSGVLTFDIVSRKAIRSLEIISEDNHIFWEGTPNSLEIYNLDSKSLKHVETYDEIIKDKNYASNIIENVYLEELKIYLDKINNKKNLERYTFEDDKYVIKIMNVYRGSTMKICFFGLESIGQKYLKNFKKILDENQEKYEIHAYRSRKNNNKILNVDKEIFSLEELENNYDIIFITNPTSLHFSTLKNIVEKTKHIFLEKPLFDDIDYDLDEIKLKDGVYYVAAPLRHTGIVKKIKEIIKDKSVYSVRAICSSYLPEWRPTKIIEKFIAPKKS